MNRLGLCEKERLSLARRLLRPEQTNGLVLRFLSQVDALGGSLPGRRRGLRAAA